MLCSVIGYLDLEIIEVDDGVLGIGKGDLLVLILCWIVMVVFFYFIDLSNGGIVVVNVNYFYCSDM